MPEEPLDLEWVVAAAAPSRQLMGLIVSEESQGFQFLAHLITNQTLISAEIPSQDWEGNRRAMDRLCVKGWAKSAILMHHLVGSKATGASLTL